MTTKNLTDDIGKVYTGLNKAAKVVSSTMGAKGKTVGIFDNLGELRFTKDGVSVAKSISLEDPVENIGAQLLINSANKTVEEVGDGTTTTSVLLSSMVDLNLNILEVERDLQTVIDRVKESSTEITEVSEIISIATIASNSERLGKLIGKIYSEVGFNAFVNLNFGVTPTTEYEVKRGFEFNSGFISPRFKNQDNGDCVFNDAIIITDENKASDFDKYLQMLNTAASLQKPLVVISPEFSSQVIRLVMDNVRKQFPVCLIKAPGFGKQVTENFRDLEAVTSDEGRVDEIVIGPTTFTIYNDNCPDLEGRIKEVKSQLTSSFIEPHDEHFINNRLHKLQGTTALIYAGGITEKNMKEEYDRLEDAIGAVKAAIKSGYVRGGGYSLLEASKGTYLEELGTYPNKTILDNANMVFDTEYKVGEEINVKTNEKEDFLKSGIIDPTEVVVQSLINSTASFRLLNDTKYIIYNEQNAKNPLFGG